MTQCWHPRAGRGQDYTLWDDSLLDALARVGLNRESIYEQPPSEPKGFSLDAERMKLFTDAVDQYQAEGTVLFETVRPSLIIDGVYASRDIGLIQTWKNGAVKDGRSLLRWALSFVDRSSLSDQMRVVSELHAKVLSPSATLFEMSEHFLVMWDLWLSLTNSDRDEPASFFRQMLISMPTAPECPVVHVRRKFVDMVEDNHASLRDVDGEKGLFFKLESFGKTLGISDKVPPSLNALGGAPLPPEQGGVGGQRFGRERENDGGDGKKCKDCRAFACKLQGGSCICKAASKYDLSKIEQKGRRDYCKLMRRYNAANPGKTLQVSVKVIREAMGEPDPNAAAAKPGGKVVFMASAVSVLGEGDDDKTVTSDDIEKWLAEHTEGADDGLFVMGDATSVGDVQFSIVEEEWEAPPPLEEIVSTDPVLLSLDSSGSSAHSATDAENEIKRLKAQLLIADARAVEMEAERRAPPASQASARPSPPINLALERPLAGMFNNGLVSTPKELYKWAQSGPTTPAPTGGGMTTSVRQPRFTPSSVNTIREEDDTSAGGADRLTKTKTSAAALMAKAMVRAEEEKLKLDELIKKDKGKIKILRILARLCLRVAHNAVSLTSAGVDRALDMHTYQLVIAGLSVYGFGGKVKPLIKLGVAYLSKMVLNLGISKFKCLLLSMWSTAGSSISSLAAVVFAKLVALALKQSVLIHVPSAGTGTPSRSPSLNAGSLLALRPSPRLGDAVLMSSDFLNSSDGAKPALMDNGASSNTSCAKSLDGAIAGTFRSEDAGEIGLGSDNATLRSEGSYLYALKRGAVNSSELVIRRLKYCPNLPMPFVFSEATENKKHGYGIYWPPGKPRVMVSPDNTVLELHMSSVDLGWLRVNTVTDQAVVLSMLKKTKDTKISLVSESPLINMLKSDACLMRNQITLYSADAGGVQVEPPPDSKYKFCSNCGTPGKLCEFAACMRGVCCQPNPQCPQCSGQADGVVGQLSVKRMDPSKVRTVGMVALKPLRGVELLRRRHCTDGHASLPITVKNLKLEGLFDTGMVTLKDVEIFSKQGCGPCELAKMRRRPFSIKVETERVAAPLLGDHFTFDVLEVRTPCIHTGAKFLYVVIEKVSKYAIGGSMRGYSEENVVSALNEIKARVRPVHGEINIFRMDSHPSHRSKHVRDYLIDNQQHLQLSPSYVHEGVGDVENYFLHRVPSANALIIAAPDLDESHFAQALFYVIDASNHSVTSGSMPPKSPSMIYHSLDKFNPSGLQVFGSAAMAFVHGEARGSKFNEHAVPCIYMGPAINSDSRAHCCVFLKREYKDVDLGCINVTERVVLERTHRGHPSTQPYNQVAAEEAVDLGKPASIFDLSGMDYTDDELPHFSPVVWVRGAAEPTVTFVLLLWHGPLHAGDMTSWILEFTRKGVNPYPIDLVIGGQEHNLTRAPIKAAVLRMQASEHCLGSFCQPECRWYTASRYNQPGPPVLFDLNNVDGIPDEDSELPLEVMQALNVVKFCADLFRVAAESSTPSNSKVCILEFPASQGAGSPFAAKGRELHSTIADTSIMSALIVELNLSIIYTEQGAAGALSRKPTSLLSTENAAHSLRRTVGTHFVQPGTKQFDSILGVHADGSYKTKASARYTAKFAMQLAIALLGTRGQPVHDATDEPATDDLHPAGSRVELFWFEDKVWYRGTVMNTRVRKGMVHGLSVSRREIQVRYDADEALLWHAVCDYSVRSVSAADDDGELDPMLMVLAAIAARNSSLSPGGALHMHMLNDPHGRFGVPLGDAVVADSTGNMVTNESCNNVVASNDPNVFNSVPRVSDDDPTVLNSMLGASIDAEPLLFDSMPRAIGDFTGHIFNMHNTALDLCDGSVVSSPAFYAVLGDNSVVEVDVTSAHQWHTPSNEREYHASPQQALWRTAKELKMENYAQVNMFELVLESSVDQTKYKIYDTLWVYKIKFSEGGNTFQKLNPRWCVKGGSMDRSLYKAYAEMMRPTSVGIMWGLKANYYDKLAAGAFDLSDAFQGTSTVDADGKLQDGESEFYTRQAAGFVKYGPNGEKLVCRQLCFMQGRIDATSGFDKRFMQILTKSAFFRNLLWDSKVLKYNNTSLANTTASLDEIIDHAHDRFTAGVDSEPQMPPQGFALLGVHVDDMGALATGKLRHDENRIFAFVRGEIATSYACKLTQWHGTKMLGFDLNLCDELKTVTITAQGAIDTVRAKLLTKDNLTITPKHIVTESVYTDCPGDIPEMGDPDRSAYLERQSLTRSILGVGIWLCTCYPQLTSGINAMCANMASPGDERLAQLRHMFMHLGEKPQGKTFGGPTVTGCCASDVEIAPFTMGTKSGEYHFFSDASLGGPGVTGGIGMFAGGCIQSLSLRQHLVASGSHIAEVVALSTNVTHIMPVNGLLQELGVRGGKPTRTYLDSQSTIFVATSDTAPKKSVWLARRTKVVTETVQMGEVEPIHIGEADMCADSFTKYVKLATYLRHMHYILNMPGDPPDCHEAGWVRVPLAKSKAKAKPKAWKA